MERCSWQLNPPAAASRPAEGTSSNPLTIDADEFQTSMGRKKLHPLPGVPPNIKQRQRPRTQVSRTSLLPSQSVPHAPRTRTAFKANAQFYDEDEDLTDLNFTPRPSARPGTSAAPSVAHVFDSNSLTATRIKEEQARSQLYTPTAGYSKRVHNRPVRPDLSSRDSGVSKARPSSTARFEAQTLNKFEQTKHGLEFLQLKEALASGASEKAKLLPSKSLSSKAQKSRFVSAQSQTLRTIAAESRNKASPSAHAAVLRDRSVSQIPFYHDGDDNDDDQQDIKGSEQQKVESTQVTSREWVIPSSECAPTKNPSENPSKGPSQKTSQVPDTQRSAFEARATSPQLQTSVFTRSSSTPGVAIKSSTPAINFSQETASRTKIEKKKPTCDVCSKRTYACMCLDPATGLTTYRRCDRCLENRHVCRPSRVVSNECKNCFDKGEPCVYTPIAERSTERRKSSTRGTTPRSLTQPLTPAAIPVARPVKRATEGQKCFSEAWRQAYLEELAAEGGTAVEHLNKGIEGEGDASDDEDDQGGKETNSGSHFVYNLFYKRWSTQEGDSDEDADEHFAGGYTDLSDANQAVSRVAASDMTAQGSYDWIMDEDGKVTITVTSGNTTTRAWLQREVQASEPYAIKSESMRVPRKLFMVMEKIYLTRDTEAALALDLEDALQEADSPFSSASSAPSMAMMPMASTAASSPPRLLTSATTITGSETQDGDAQTQSASAWNRYQTGELVLSEKPVGMASYTTLDLANRQAGDYLLNKYILASAPRLRNLDQVDLWKVEKRRVLSSHIDALDRSGDVFSECLEGPRSIIPPGFGDDQTHAMVAIRVDTVIVDGPRN